MVLDLLALGLLILNPYATLIYHAHYEHVPIVVHKIPRVIRQMGHHFVWQMG